MALITIGETLGRRGTYSEDWILTFKRVFWALFDQTDDEYFVVTNVTYGGVTLAPNVPHPTFALAKVLNIDAELTDPTVNNPATNTACSRWKISVDYGPWNPLTHTYNGNPLSVPTTFAFDFTTAEVAAFEDVDGNPIVNSAGDPYDPPLMREVTRCTLIVQRNESASADLTNLSTLAALSNTLNVATFNGFPPKTVRLAPIKIPEIQYSQSANAFYFPMRYEFDINFDTWVKQVVNAGFRELDSSGNLIPILINGQPASVPVPLTEAGKAILTPGSVDSSGDTPPDSSSGGSTGEVPGGGEPPEGGNGDTGTGEGTPNIIIDAYDLIRTSDFTVLGMNSLFTLPSLG